MLLNILSCSESQIVTRGCFGRLSFKYTNMFSVGQSSVIVRQVATKCLFVKALKLTMFHHQTLITLFSSGAYKLDVNYLTITTEHVVVETSKLVITIAVQ